MPSPAYRTVVVTIPRSADREWVRTRTAWLRDLPGVQCVTVEVGRVLVTGRLDAAEVRMILAETVPSGGAAD
jgi:hypothetical protein